MYSSAQFRDRVLKYAGINFDTGDARVKGNLTVSSNNNYVANYTGLPATSFADVRGNLVGTFANMSGNITTAYFFGDGSKISGINNGPLPSVINTDVTGNLTGATANTTGTMSTGSFFIGNGSLISNIVSTLPSRANADILRGNIVAAGNVDAQNVTARILRVSGSTFVTGQINTVGNVTASYLIGNGYLLTDITSTLPKTANMNIIGNVVGSNVNASNVSTNTLRSYGTTTVRGQVNVIGNVSGNLSGNGAFLTNVFTGNLSRDVIGNVAAPGNISAGLFVGNGYYLDLNGSTIQPQGNVPNQAARLAVRSGIGTIVYQDDVQRQFLLTNLPASLNANWTQFSGNNFPVTSVFGRTGDIVLISGTDIQTFGNQQIAGSGDISVANIDIRGNMNGSNATMTNLTTTTLTTGNARFSGQVNVSGNTSALFYFGNAAGITNALYNLPSRGNLNITGNVISPSSVSGNVDAANISSNSATINGNLIIAGQLTVLQGNVSTNFLFGNGSQLTGVLPVFGAISSINIIGNVTASANVDAVNVSTVTLGVGNLFASGQINTTANVVASFFSGNGSTLTGANAVLVNGQSINIIGNVQSSANVDAANINTNLLRTYGNVIVNGQINVIGNVTALNFYGNGVNLTGIVANLTSSQVMNISGNVSASANIDAANINTSILFVNGNAFITGQTNVIGNVIANTFIGNGFSLTNVNAAVTASQTINVFGNVSAPGNVNASNVTANIFTVNGNIVSTGQLFTVTGNVVGNTFFGNGVFLTSVRVTGTQNVNVIGNVTSTGNVDASNVSANAMTVNGNATMGQLDVTGNLTAQFLIGDGSSITNVPACTAPTSVCFVQPSSGFTSNTAIYNYAPYNGWSFVIPSNSQPRTIGIQTYSLPLNPSVPFSGLPSNVAQNVTTAWAFSNGIWSANVELRSNGGFGPTSMNMGFSNYFGRYLGNSSNTVISSVDIPNQLGFTNVDNTIPVNIIASYINPTTGNISMCFQGNNKTYLGLTWAPGVIYYALVDKNFNLLGWNQISSQTGNSGAVASNITNYVGTNSGYFASETELYFGFANYTASGAGGNAIYNALQIYNLSTPVYVTSTASSRMPYIARVNPSAQVATWVGAFATANTISASFPINLNSNAPIFQISPSPDMSKIRMSVKLVTSGAELLLRYSLSSTPASIPNFTIASVANVSPSGYKNIDVSFWAANGIMIEQTMNETAANVSGGNVNVPFMNSFTNAWSADSNTAYYFVGSDDNGYVGLNWRSWNGQSSGTWTTRANNIPNFGNNQFNNITYTLMRVPINDIANGNWVANAVQIGNAFTPSYFIRPGALAYSGDGNLWFAATVYKNGTTYTGNSTFTFAGNSITTPTINTSGLGFYGLWKILDSNGSYSSMTLLSNSSEVSNTSKYAACATTYSISLGRNTAKGVGVMQISSVSNISNISFATPAGNVFCRGLTNPSNTQLTSFDIYPNLFVDGFNAVSNVILANACNGERIIFGNAIDYNYSLQSLLPAFVKLNIDNTP